MVGKPAPQTKKKNTPGGVFPFLVAEKGFEPHDLRVMSPTSYQTAPLRDIWCRKPGSNRYEKLISRDFKSRASANSAIPAYVTVLVFRYCLSIISLNLPIVNTFLHFFKKCFSNIIFCLDKSIRMCYYYMRMLQA